MKTYKWRVFHPSTPIHVYQLSFDGGVIFYDEILILMHMLILAKNARKYQVKILALTHMVTHYHCLAMANSNENFEMCFGETASEYTRKYNRFMGRNGPLFRTPFDYSPKRKDKDVRTSLNYIANNGPEKGLSSRAVLYRWNYLMYAPFDAGESINNASYHLHEKYSRDLIIAVDCMRWLARKGKVPSFEYFVEVRKRLIKKEWNIFRDIVISESCPVDFTSAASYFGSIAKMISAPDNNTGSEYEIDELHDFSSYIPYRNLSSVIYKRDKVWSPFIIKSDEMPQTAQNLHQKTNASSMQISLFLHINKDVIK